MSRTAFKVLFFAAALVSVAAVVSCNRSKKSAEPAAEEEEVIVSDVKYNSETGSLEWPGGSYRLITVEPGTFTMGPNAKQEADARDWEKPAHQVTLTKSYMIGETEVTQELWVAVMGENPSMTEGENLPVECVSWNLSHEFISRLNKITGLAFSLPSEAQWEFAAMGGNLSQGCMYPGSDNLDDVAWYQDNSGNTVHPVAQKKPNELGIYDMAGNVWEWCEDYYRGAYPSAEPQTDPLETAKSDNIIRRGGCWGGFAYFCRHSFRAGLGPSLGGNNCGLRIVLN